MNKRKIFICNDVGAAEQISNLIKYKKIKHYSTILTNTSKKIFIKNKVKKYIPLKKIILISMTQ